VVELVAQVADLEGQLAEATANALRMAADLADRLATLVDDSDEKATIGKKILNLKHQIDAEKGNKNG
jgi:hypothetical protein